jgi:hypothetical protein
MLWWSSPPHLRDLPRLDDHLAGPISAEGFRRGQLLHQRHVHTVVVVSDRLDGLAGPLAGHGAVVVISSQSCLRPEFKAQRY